MYNLKDMVSMRVFIYISKAEATYKVEPRHDAVKCELRLNHVCVNMYQAVAYKIKKFEFVKRFNCYVWPWPKLPIKN